MSLFTDFFCQHADCLSAAEQAQALEAAAGALRADPTPENSGATRRKLLERGGLAIRITTTAPVHYKACAEWFDRAFTPEGLRAVARELSDAAQDLAAAHGLCAGCLRDQSECACGADAADRAHDRYRSEGRD